MTTFDDSDWTDETNEKDNEKENELEEEETSTCQITSFLGCIGSYKGHKSFYTVKKVESNPPTVTLVN